MDTTDPFVEEQHLSLRERAKSAYLSNFEVGKGDSDLEILLEMGIAGARGNRKNALTVRYARVSKVKQKGFCFY